MKIKIFFKFLALANLVAFITSIGPIYSLVDSINYGEWKDEYYLSNSYYEAWEVL